MMKAISYTRFSSKPQELGHSLERQDDRITTWLKANPGFELDTSLSFHDAAVSAYRGKNAKKGKLAAFLKLIEEGKIPSGSVLLVEEWSRFSRDNPYDGAPVSRKIFDAGVGIIDLLNNTRYDAESLRRDMGLRIRLDVEWERAWQESRIKGERVADAWARKRARAAISGTPLTAMCPAWLRLCNGRYEVIEHRAATVRLIFAMKADGIGSETIARRLNAMADVWHPEPHAKNRRGGWWPSYIEKIVRNPAVIGTFVSPKLDAPIEHFFPPVVDVDLFNIVASKRARIAQISNHGASNTNGAVNNIFGGITLCARCGSPMTYLNKGHRRPTSIVPCQYLICDKARRGLGCNKTAIRYDTLEVLLLRLCRGLDARALLIDESERMREQAGLASRRHAIDGELVQLNQQIASYMESLGHADGALKRGIEAKLREKYARQAELEQAVAGFRRLSGEATPEAVVQRLVDVEDLITRMQQLEGAERADLRRRLRSALHQLIDTIAIEASPTRSRIHIAFRDSGTLGLLLDGKGVLRLVRKNGSTGRWLYKLDEDGEVIDFDARRSKISALVSEAFAKTSKTDHMRG